MASPFTYEEMKARQREVGQTGPAGPVEAEPVTMNPETLDTTGEPPDSALLNQPAIDTEEPTIPLDMGEGAPAESTRAQVKAAPGPDPARAKRILVLRKLRNTPQGMEQFAHHIRRAFNVPSTFKATPEEVLGAGFRLTQAQVPDVTPDEYIKSMHKLYGPKVDSTLLSGARQDYPGNKDDAALIDEVYNRQIAKEELAPLTWADKASIIARRYPALHKSDVEPEKALRTVYDAQKTKGKDVGSFDDWIHTQMAPTLAEMGYGLVGGLKDAIVSQAKSVGTFGAALPKQGEIAKVAAEAQAGVPGAKEKLQEIAKGGVNVAALAAGPLAKAGIGAAEAALGVAKTAPVLAGALEGAAAGGLQGGGEAAVEGQSPMQVVQQAAIGAGAGGGLGALAEGLHARGAAKTAARQAAEAQAADEAAKVAGAGEVPPPAEPAAAAAPPTDVLELAARHKAEVGWEQQINDFAKQHGMDREDVAALVTPAEPALTDLAKAQSLHGVSAADVAELRKGMPEWMGGPAEVPTPELTPAQQNLKNILARVGTPEERAGLEAAIAAGSRGPGEGLAKNLPSAESAAAPVAAPLAESPATPAGAASAAPAERGLLQEKVAGPLARVQEGMAKAQGQLEQRRAMRRAALSQRLGEATRRFGAVGGGLAGWKAKLSAMAGEITRPDWAGIKDMFSEVDIDALYNAIEHSNMTAGDKMTAGNGLRRLLGGHRLGAPTASQLRALRLAFGEEFTKSASQNRTLWKEILHQGMRTLNTPRTAMTSLDLSAGMRQGYLMTSRKEYWRAWDTMRKAFGDGKVEDAVVDQIKNNDLYDVMRASGVKFQGQKMAGEASENFAGSLIDEWHGVKQSQRAYDTFINKLRSDVFTNVYREFEGTGVDVSDPHFRESLAHWVNTGTGRGSMGLLGRDAGVLNAVAFSPRLAWSRWETFNPMYYKSLHPAIAKKAALANLKTVAATMSLLGVMAGSGLAKVGWDPRNSDFAKLKFGNTRLDLLAGHQQLVRLFAQMVTGKVISSTTGKEVDLNGSDQKNGWARAGMTRLDVLGRFMEAKAAPLASLVINQWRGQDFLGRPISMPNEVLTRLTPMPIQDIRDAIGQTGWGAGLIAAPAALVGLGVQSYAPTMPVSAGGVKKPDYGVAMEGAQIGKELWDHLNGNATDRQLKYVTPKLADQWMMDAAMAQVMGQQEATRTPHFFDPGFDQKSAIRKATARRMARVNKLYKDLAGGNGEQARLAAEKTVLQRRADVTGMDIEALRNPDVYREVSK